MRAAELRISKALDVWSLVAALCMSATVAPTLQAAEQWSLMARHGECASVASLEHKVPELGEVRDPQAFAALMRKGGQKVTVKQIPTGMGSAYEVVVPERELSLVLVPTGVCGPSRVH